MKYNVPLPKSLVFIYCNTNVAFFSVPLEGLRSQSQFDEMRTSYIRELVKAIGLRQKGVVANSQRFYQLTKLMDSMHDVSLLVNLCCYCCCCFKSEAIRIS